MVANKSWYNEEHAYGKGGNGGYAKSINVQLTKGQNITITVGAGGAARYQEVGYLSPSEIAYAGSGGTSSVAGYVTGNGGGGASGKQGVEEGINGNDPHYYPIAYNGSNGGASGGNNANTTGGGAAGGNGNAAGTKGWCRITYTGN